MERPGETPVAVLFEWTLGLGREHRSWPTWWSRNASSNRDSGPVLGAHLGPNIVGVAATQGSIEGRVAALGTVADLLS